MYRQKGRNGYEAKQKEALVDGNLVPADIPAVDNADVETFDKVFPPKEKLKLPGQIFD